MERKGESDGQGQLAINGRGSIDDDSFNPKLRKGSNGKRERELRRRGGAGTSLVLECRIEGGKTGITTGGCGCKGAGEGIRR
jgi:hypothetical protein